MVTPNRSYPLVSAAEYLDTDWVTKLQSLANMVDTDVAALIAQLDTDATLAANSNTKVPSQAAIKSYVDNMVTGLAWKQAVRAATTANATLASGFENGDAIDGVTLATGDRILIKNQSAGAENGVYTVNASGAPTRAVDVNIAAEVIGATVSVREGTANADTQWTCTNNSVTLGTTALVFAQMSGAGTYTATGGVVLTGNQFAADAGTSGHKLPWLDGANTWSSTQIVSNGAGRAEVRATGDIVGYRTGGTTGYHFFNSASTAYIGFDGTNFTFQQPSGNVNIGGDPFMTRGANETATGSKIFTKAVTVQANSEGYQSANSGGTLQWIHGYRTDIAGNDDFVIYRGGFGTTVVFKTGGGVRFNTYGAGTLVTDSSGNITASSDERLKIMRRQFKRGLADMLKMDAPRFYRWRKLAGMDDAEYVGFGAQGVRQGIPEAVGKDPRGFLTLQDRPLIATHHNAILELLHRIERLEGRAA